MIPSPLPSPGPDRLPDGYRVAGPGQKEGPWQNRLALAHSPYLRQHASNPVDWYPWGPAAWAAAAARQRPIFLSVGYAACHWCHVMEHESFSDPSVAAILNAGFVSVKVDREEHPALDAVAMDALLHLTGEGGWPLHLWLTPEGLPWHGAIYLPPYARYGLTSLRDLLRRLAEQWEDRPEGVRAEAARVWERVQTQAAPTPGRAPGAAVAQEALSRLVASYDRRCGGWGDGAKFPQVPRVELLLDHATRDPAARETLAHLLGTIERSGLHDHVGGGFHRYATDPDWEVPHFEKMLYDNALLARAFLRGWSALGERRWLTAGCRALEYLLDTLQNPEGLYGSSQDADDAGGEGHYYTWTPQELQAALGAQAGAVAAATGVVVGGNADGGRSTIRRLRDDDRLALARPRLVAARQARPAPAIDPKVVVGWNGLAISALATAAALLGEARYLAAAERAAGAILGAVRLDALPRTLAPDAPGGVLDDHALLAEGLLDLYVATGALRWLSAASDLAGQILARFLDPETGAPLQAPCGELGLRRSGWEEGAEPSAAGVTLGVLVRLHALGDRGVSAEVLDRALGSAAAVLARTPDAAPTAARAIDLHSRLRTVVIAGPAPAPLLQAARTPWRPDVLVAVSGDPERFSAFAHKQATARARAWVCEGDRCRAPVSDPMALSAILDAR